MTSVRTFHATGTRCRGSTTRPDFAAIGSKKSRPDTRPRRRMTAHPPPDYTSSLAWQSDGNCVTRHRSAPPTGTLHSPGPSTRRPLAGPTGRSAGAVMQLAVDLGGERDVLAAGVAAGGASDDLFGGAGLLPVRGIPECDADLDGLPEVRLGVLLLGLVRSTCRSGPRYGRWRVPGSSRLRRSGCTARVSCRCRERRGRRRAGRGCGRR